MRALIIIILLILPNILFANEKYTIKALEKSSHRLTESGFVTYDLPPDSWTINVENGNYFLVLRDGKVALDIMKLDENVIVLRQPSQLSGYRIFTFFKKSHKFSIAETGYVHFPEEALKLGYMSEEISISFGSYQSD